MSESRYGQFLRTAKAIQDRYYPWPRKVMRARRRVLKHSRLARASRSGRTFDANSIMLSREEIGRIVNSSKFQKAHVAYERRVLTQNGGATNE